MRFQPYFSILWSSRYLQYIESQCILHDFTGGIDVFISKLVKNLHSRFPQGELCSSPYLSSNLGLATTFVHD